MPAHSWHITVILTRQKTDHAPHVQEFKLEVDPDEYVLDGIERIWAYHDRSLVFRHACHHSTCGACGMRVNGVEKLTCITPFRSVTRDGGMLRVEPLRNFPVISDLVVDMSDFYVRLEQARLSQVAPVDGANLSYEKDPDDGGSYERLVDCIECGCCISACPISRTTPAYLGPAILAAIQESYRLTGDPKLLDFGDQENGAWRCHSAYECTEVCPSNVDPAWRIMDLRRMITADRIQRLFSGRRNHA